MLIKNKQYRIHITNLRHFFCTGTLRSVRSIWRCIHGLYVLITCALRCAVQFGTTPRSRKALNTSLILPQPFGGGKGETGFATLARDGRFQPYPGVPDGLHSLTWQRVRRVTKEELQPRLFNTLPVQSSYQHHTFTINQTCQIYIDRTQPPNGDRPVATCRKRCRPRTRCLSPTVRGTDLRTSPGARGRKGHRSHWGVTNMSQTCLLQPTNLSTSPASVPRSSEPATTREQRSIQGPHWLGGALSTLLTEVRANLDITIRRGLAKGR